MSDPKQTSTGSVIPTGEYQTTAPRYASTIVQHETRDTLPGTPDLLKVQVGGQTSQRISIAYDPEEQATRQRIRRLNDI